MNIVKVLACDVSFYVAQCKLVKAKYFEGALNFTDDLNGDDAREIKTDLEPEVFKYIVEHMKYGKLSDPASAQIKKIEQMANYLLYEPLYNYIAKPQKTKLYLNFTRSGKTTNMEISKYECDFSDYLNFCMELARKKLHAENRTFPYKMGGDFFSRAYLNDKEDIFETDVNFRRYRYVYSCVERLRADLHMSVSKMEVFNTSDRILVGILLVDDGLELMVGRNLNLVSSARFSIFNENEEMRKAPVVLYDFTACSLDCPRVYYRLLEPTAP